MATDLLSVRGRLGLLDANSAGEVPKVVEDAEGKPEDGQAAKPSDEKPRRECEHRVRFMSVGRTG